jgi:hypothetical protein
LSQQPFHQNTNFSSGSIVLHVTYLTLLPLKVISLEDHQGYDATVALKLFYLIMQENVALKVR